MNDIEGRLQALEKLVADLIGAHPDHTWLDATGLTRWRNAPCDTDTLLIACSRLSEDRAEKIRLDNLRRNKENGISDKISQSYTRNT